jgi:hypothetical protein
MAPRRGVIALLALCLASTATALSGQRTLLQSSLSVQKCQWTGDTCKASALSTLQVTGATSSAQR